jgi:hypothetical protein
MSTMPDPGIATYYGRLEAVQDTLDPQKSKFGLTVYRGHMHCSRAQPSHPKRFFSLFIIS